ncbi:MAG: cytochrome c-type biogenesis protein [Tatlockia sp.]|jgi:cytochrome c-type biogenesis protein CcmH
MKRLLRLFLASYFLLCIPAVEANSFYPLESKQQDAQFTHLLKELRCLVCQNQDLADSNAGLAKDLREKVYELVKEKKSDTEIISYLTERYGDFILFKPVVKPLTALLWFGPLLFLLIGFFIFWRTVLRRASHA